MNSTAFLNVCSADRVLTLPWHDLDRVFDDLAGVGTVVFDLEGCGLIDSVLLGRILHARVSLARRGVPRFEFRHVDGRSRELLQLLHIDRLILLAD